MYKVSGSPWKHAVIRDISGLSRCSKVVHFLLAHVSTITVVMWLLCPTSSGVVVWFVQDIVVVFSCYLTGSWALECDIVLWLRPRGSGLYNN